MSSTKPVRKSDAIHLVMPTVLLLAKSISLFILQFRKDRGKKIAIGIITAVNVIFTMLTIHWIYEKKTPSSVFSLIYIIGIGIVQWRYYKESTHSIATKFFVGFDTAFIIFAILILMLLILALLFQGEN